MVTAALPRSNAGKLGTGRQFDNIFFSGMAVLILITVFTGFARTYFMAGVFRAPLPNLLIHIHGAVFSSWILLLITQTALVSAGRVDIHLRLGLVGFGLACLMVILGVLLPAIRWRGDSRRQVPPSIPGRFTSSPWPTCSYSRRWCFSPFAPASILRRTNG